MNRPDLDQLSAELAMGLAIGQTDGGQLIAYARHLENDLDFYKKATAHNATVTIDDRNKAWGELQALEPASQNWRMH
jgi:hypothetical protein